MKLKQPDIKGFSYLDKQKNPKSRITPMMSQYLEVKNRHKEYLLFYRMGDFYELFFDDAKIAATALGIALTKRGKIDEKEIPMCGVPVHSSESYLARLIKAGFKVAVAEQFDDLSKESKKPAKIIKRDVVKIITPGTILDESLLESKSYNHLLSIFRYKGEFSLSWVDMTTGSIKFQQIVGINFIEDLKESINKIEPCEIIVSNESRIKENFNEILKNYENIITEVPNSFFCAQDGEDKIKNYYSQSVLESNKNLSNNEKSTIGSLLNYLELTQKKNIPNLKTLEKIQPTSYLQIDFFSEKSLEIFIRNDGEKKGSLLETIDETKTSSGGRLLKDFFKHPRIDLETIQFRHECIESFFSELDSLKKIRGFLTGIPDAERALARISAYTNNPRDLVVLCSFIEKALEIFKEIKKLSNKSLNHLLPKKIVYTLLERILNLIDSHIITPPPISLNDGGVIKDKISQRLDDLRNIKQTHKKMILDLQAKYILTTGVNNLKIKFNNFHGYFIETTNRHTEKIVQSSKVDFKLLQNTLNNSRFYTDELRKISNEIENAEFESIEVEKGVYKKICNEINKEIFNLGLALEKIAFIDVITSFSELSYDRNYVRPEIVKDKKIIIKNGRHPVVEESLKKTGEEFTPNDCNFEKKETTWLMTGPNMAGKSTFLRQTAIIIILNQIGCYVPADSAKLSIFDKIFTRIGASDNLAQGMSTFMTEMVETSKIINEATDSSLVILDELGRGTSTEDGLAIARAVLEFLIEKKGCITLFATHYKDLCKLKEKYNQIMLKTMQFKKWNDEIIFLYKVIDGISEGSFGIHVANLAGIDDTIVIRAKEILEKIKGNTKEVNLKKPDFKGFEKKNIEFEKIVDLIKSLDLDNITPKDSLDVLYTIKKNYLK